jgi:hypothetical protein
MFNVSHFRFLCELDARKKLPSVFLLIGKTDAKNERRVWEKYGDESRNVENFIGFVKRVPAGNFTGQCSLPCPAELNLNSIGYSGADTEDECIRILREEYQKRKELIEKLKDPRELLNFELHHYDRFHDYSDDYRVWASGNAAWNRIKKLCEQLGVEPAAELARIDAEKTS